MSKQIENMKILEIIEGLGPGGAQRFVVDLSNELSKGNNVSLLSFIKKNRSDFYEPELSKNVKHLKYKYALTGINTIKIALRICRDIKRIKPDIVHLHSRAFAYCIVASLLFPRIKFYYTVHNVADKDAGNGMGAKLRKFFLKRTIRPVTISNYCEQTFKKFYKYDSKGVIENGCRELSPTPQSEHVTKEIERLKPTPRTKVYCCIARFMVQKNHELLIESFNKVIDDGEDVLLLLIGDDTSQHAERANSLKKSVKNPERIIFLGAKHNVVDYLYNSDYFVLSSSWEGLPITILEAGLSGCYTVSTPVGGVPDVIDSESIGLLSDDLSFDSFVKVIRKSLTMTYSRDAIKKYFESKYTMAKCANKYIELFNS